MPVEVALANGSGPGSASQGPQRVWILIGPRAEGCARWGVAPQVLLRALRTVQPSARLFLMDLAGAGRQRAVTSPSHVPMLVTDLRERLAQAGIPANELSLMGFSLGALVATEWTRAHPHEVAALVLLNPAMRPFTPIVRSTPLTLWPQALKVLLARDAAREPSTGASLATALRHGLARWRYASSRRRPINQVLLLAGQGDPWRDWRVAQRISRAWGAALRMHPQAGHDLLMDDPQWVARAVADWLLPVGHSAGRNATNA